MRQQKEDAEKRWRIGVELSGCRLIDFLRQHLPGPPSLKVLKRYLSANCCKINGRLERFPATTLGVGDLITFALPQTPETAVLTQFGQRVLYSDEYFVAVDKPVGVTWEDKNYLQGLIPTHRLDRDTSGVWLLARNKAAAEAAEELFRQRAMTKEYLALVDGWPVCDEGVIKNYLAKQHSYQGQALWGEAVAPQTGLYAHTDWQLVTRFSGGYSLLRCHPHTGRTHQIRVHLCSIGHPILGDFHYCRAFRSSYPAKRCMLHASALSFVHPYTKVSISLTAPCQIFIVVE